MVRNRPQELRILVNPNPRVSGRIAARDLDQTVRAAVIDDGVVPILIGLRNNALNAFSKKVAVVVYRRNNTHQRRPFRNHLPPIASMNVR